MLPHLLPLAEAALARTPNARYIEPFVGGAALFWALRARGFTGPADLSDTNPSLIVFYQVLQGHVEELIDCRSRMLLEYPAGEGFYRLRKDFNDSRIQASTMVASVRERTELAARFLLLNKTCHGGLWRVNAAGALNSSWGKYARPSHTPDALLRVCSLALTNTEVLATSWHTVFPP